MVPARILILFVIPLFVSPALSAQMERPPSQLTPSTRGGMWVGVGIGAGSSLVSCAICREERQGGPSGYIKIGGTLRPALLIGAEGTVWVHGGDELDQYLGALTVASYLYPRAGSGFFVKGGLSGLRYVASEDGAEEDEDATATTLGLNLGVGYEFRVRPGYSLVPFLNLVASSFGSLSQGGERLAGDLNVTLIQFGLGMTGH